MAGNWEMGLASASQGWAEPAVQTAAVPPPRGCLLKRLPAQEVRPRCWRSSAFTSSGLSCTVYRQAACAAERDRVDWAGRGSAHQASMAVTCSASPNGNAGLPAAGSRSQPQPKAHLLRPVAAVAQHLHPERLHVPLGAAQQLRLGMEGQPCMPTGSVGCIALALRPASPQPHAVLHIPSTPALAWGPSAMSLSAQTSRVGTVHLPPGSLQGGGHMARERHGTQDACTVDTAAQPTTARQHNRHAACT